MCFSLSCHPFKFSSLLHIEIYSQGTFDNYWCPYFWILLYLHFKICLQYEKKGFCLSYSFLEGEEESHLGSGWEGFLMAACFLNWQWLQSNQLDDTWTSNGQANEAVAPSPLIKYFYHKCFKNYIQHRWLTIISITWFGEVARVSKMVWNQNLEPFLRDFISWRYVIYCPY